METVDRIEKAVEKLIEQNLRLKKQNESLHQEQCKWKEDRAYLLGEIDRILRQLDSIQMEES